MLIKKATEMILPVKVIGTIKNIYNERTKEYFKINRDQVKNSGPEYQRYDYKKRQLVTSRKRNFSLDGYNGLLRVMGGGRIFLDVLDKKLSNDIIVIRSISHKVLNHTSIELMNGVFLSYYDLTKEELSNYIVNIMMDEERIKNADFVPIFLWQKTKLFNHPKKNKLESISSRFSSNSGESFAAKNIYLKTIKNLLDES